MKHGTVAALDTIVVLILVIADNAFAPLVMPGTVHAPEMNCIAVVQ